MAIGVLREQQPEAACLAVRQAKLDAACLRQAQRGRQVAVNLKELGYLPTPRLWQAGCSCLVR